MKKVLVIVLLFTGFNVLAQDTRSICVKLNELNNNILHGWVKRKDAIAPFKTLLAELKLKVTFNRTENWIFPLQGYRASAIGGVEGNGYSDKGYDYFDGHKHLAHPAHDIFIRDKNQDGMDDKTQQPVNVLAVADGIVIACSNEWYDNSALRGGRYIWLYHPQLNTITYYAHSRTVLVAPGDEVKQGQKIAEVGRTGFNAFKRRSPPHLHFGAYRLITELPVPFNCYPKLTKAQTQ